MGWSDALTSPGGGSPGRATLALVVWVVVPIGVVTVIVLGSDGSTEISMRYPTGRNVLKP